MDSFDSFELYTGTSADLFWATLVTRSKPRYVNGRYDPNSPENCRAEEFLEDGFIDDGFTAEDEDIEDHHDASHHPYRFDYMTEHGGDESDDGQGHEEGDENDQAFEDDASGRNVQTPPAYGRLHECPSQEIFEAAGGQAEEEWVPSGLLFTSEAKDNFGDEDGDYYEAEEEFIDEEANLDLWYSYQSLDSWSSFQSKWLESPERASLQDDNTRCPLCCDDYEGPNVLPIQLPCKGRHIICLDCARNWFKGIQASDGPQQTNACPLCREKLFLFDEYWQTHDWTEPGLEGSEDEELDQQQAEAWQYEEPQDEARQLDFAISQISLSLRGQMPQSPGLFLERQHAAAQRWAMNLEEATIAVRDPDFFNDTQPDITPEEEREGVIAMVEMFFFGYLEAREASHGDGILSMVKHPATAYALLKLIEILHWHKTGQEASNSLAAFEEHALRFLHADSRIAARYEAFPPAWSRVVEELIRCAVDAMYAVRQKNRDTTHEINQETMERFENLRL